MEFTTSGVLVAEYDVDSSEGGAFGLDTVLEGYPPWNYAVVDDVINNLSVCPFPLELRRLAHASHVSHDPPPRPAVGARAWHFGLPAPTAGDALAARATPGGSMLRRRS